MSTANLLHLNRLPNKCPYVRIHADCPYFGDLFADILQRDRREHYFPGAGKAEKGGIGMKVDFRGEEIKIYGFNELEAYKVARKLEEDSIYYYSRMKEEVLSPKIRDAVEMLLGGERRHLILFEEKIAEFARESREPDKEETLPDIVDSHVMEILKDSRRVADILCDPQEALRLGIAVENRSIAFYGNLLQTTRDDSGRKAIQELIREEKEHLKKLEGLLRK